MVVVVVVVMVYTRSDMDGGRGSLFWSVRGKCRRHQ
jgi:hypothetical protein